MKEYFYNKEYKYMYFSNICYSFANALIERLEQLCYIKMVYQYGLF